MQMSRVCRTEPAHFFYGDYTKYDCQIYPTVNRFLNTLRAKSGDFLSVFRCISPDILLLKRKAYKNTNTKQNNKSHIEQNKSKLYVAKIKQNQTAKNK